MGRLAPRPRRPVVPRNVICHGGTPAETRITRSRSVFPPSPRVQAKVGVNVSEVWKVVADICGKVWEKLDQVLNGLPALGCGIPPFTD